MRQNNVILIHLKDVPDRGRPLANPHRSLDFPQKVKGEISKSEQQGKVIHDIESNVNSSVINLGSASGKSP